MFVKTKIVVCLFCTATLPLLFAGSAQAQSSRSAALQQAQQRGQQIIQNRARQVQRVAQGSGSRSSLGSPVIGSGAPVINSSPLSGAPVVSNGPILTDYSSQYGSVIDGPIGGGEIIHNSDPIGDSYFDAGIVDGGYQCDDGCGAGACGYSNFNCRPCCFDGRWLRLFGSFFSNAEVIGGAQAFRSQNFTAGGQEVDDSSFGFYGGVNLGVSLAPLTFGLFSGQIGVRSSQSEFGGDIFSTDNRDQLFVTAGIFRRVDQGFQLGVAFDFLHEEWFVETDLSQIRGDISWVYGNGSALGFRFNVGVEDDDTSGLINGVAFDGLFAQVVDNFRAYYRFGASGLGHADVFAGWSDADDAVLGIDIDMPVTGALGMQAGFTYFLPEDTAPSIPTSTNDAWNLYVGFAFRPQGPRWYRNYDRPLFNVADNGTFVFDRN